MGENSQVDNLIFRYLGNTGVLHCTYLPSDRVHYLIFGTEE